MKVILTAFGGKLKSEPMDWPDNSPPDIKLTMLMEGVKFFRFDGSKAVDEPPKIKVATFKWIGLYAYAEHGQGHNARIYQLVDLS